MGVKGAALSHCIVGFAYERVAQRGAFEGLDWNLCTVDVLVYTRVYCNIGRIDTFWIVDPFFSCGDSVKLLVS